MSNYDYRKAVCDDIRTELEYRGVTVTSDNRDELYEELYDELWTDDSVTGNASGSYTFSSWEAEENLSHNWGLLNEALCEFGCSNENIADKGAEWCDVTIRCYLLGECLSAVLDELVEAFEEELGYANEWWAECDFMLMERVTGFRQDDFSEEDGYAEFVDACDEWWNDLTDEDKVSEYQNHC